MNPKNRATRPAPSGPPKAPRTPAARRPPAPAEAGGGLRLQVYLARCGLGSRRSCEQYIVDGRVAVNGRTVDRLGSRVGSGDRVALDGRLVRPAAGLVYLALHKPRGYLCANADPEGRPLASDLFRGAVAERLFHVGRLDFNSTGLIFYTNDGEFSRLITHPGSLIEKEYLVEAARPIDERLLEEYRTGIWIAGVRYRCKDWERHGERAARIVLVEGKNRELRTVFTARRIRLKRVHRIRIGSVTLKGLAPGRFRRLSEREVRRLEELAGAARTAAPPAAAEVRHGRRR